MKLFGRGCHGPRDREARIARMCHVHETRSAHGFGKMGLPFAGFLIALGSPMLRGTSATEKLFRLNA